MKASSLRAALALAAALWAGSAAAAPKANRPDPAARAQQAVEELRAAMESAAAHPETLAIGPMERWHVDHDYEIAVRELARNNYHLAWRAARRARIVLAAASALQGKE